MKQRIKISESRLKNIIRESIQKCFRNKAMIRESKDRFDNEKFQKWQEETHIPDDIMGMVKHVCEKIGIEVPEEETITYKNRGGYAYAFGKGFTLEYRTSSYEEGPGIDYSKTLLKFIKGLGFEIVDSYGNNDIDERYYESYWYYDFAYKPSVEEIESFMIWGDEYDDNNYDDYEDEGYYGDEEGYIR
jgi:hypothetical protein